MEEVGANPGYELRHKLDDVERHAHEELPDEIVDLEEIVTPMSSALCFGHEKIVTYLENLPKNTRNFRRSSSVDRSTIENRLFDFTSSSTEYDLPLPNDSSDSHLMVLFVLISAFPYLS